MSRTRRRVRVVIWLIFLLVVLAFLAYQFRSKEEFRHFEWEKFAAAFRQAGKGYLAAAVLAILLTYVIRAWRWQCFSRPAKPLRFTAVLAATWAGFSAVMLLGRAGELIRPVMIARKEAVAVSSMMAVWAVERIFDTLTVVVLLAGVLALSPTALVMNGPDSPAARVVRQAGVLVTLAALAGAGLLWSYRAKPERLGGLVRWLHRFLPARWHSGVDRALRSFEDGLKFLQRPRELLVSVLYSFALWFVICLGYWLVCQALGDEMARLPATAVVILVFFAMAGSTVQVPGVGGGFQAATIIALTALYHIEVEVAASASILLWVITFCVVLSLGIPVLVHEGWSLRQLRQIAAEQETRPACGRQASDLLEEDRLKAKVGTAL